MAILKEQIAQRVKGQLGEKEDWWHLCFDADANSYYIEHSWDHVDAYKVSRGTDSDTERHPLEGWNGPGLEKIDAARAKLEERARANRT
jgi:hypothetical protein